MRYTAAAETDIGNVKDVNQDSLTVKIAETSKGQVAFAVICDGMGGLEQGEVASAIVVQAFEEWFYSEFPQLLEGEFEKEVLKKQWIELVMQQNQKLVKYGIKNKITLGTTLTVMLCIDKKYYVLHIGDCRIYEINDSIRQITRDQSFVEREIELGHMTVEQANNDPRRNILLQCVGVNENIVPDIIEDQIKSNTSYLICSDGFRHEINMQEIHAFCHPGQNSEQKLIHQNLQFLIKLNKERNERDNISAVLLRSWE